MSLVTCMPRHWAPSKRGNLRSHPRLHFALHGICTEYYVFLRMSAGQTSPQRVAPEKGGTYGRLCLIHRGMQGGYARQTE